MKIHGLIMVLMVAACALLSGCTGDAGEKTSVTASTTLPQSGDFTTSGEESSTTVSLAAASSTASASVSTTTKPAVSPDDAKCKDLSVDICLEKEGCLICGGLCKDTACKNCTSYRRCVQVSEGNKTVSKVEVASRSGESCVYVGDYIEDYCAENEGDLIDAKCGSAPMHGDCVELYGEAKYYLIAKQRSFHSPDGEEYDLYCFSCTKP